MAHAFSPSSLIVMSAQLTRRKYFVGVDLGQTTDPTAICVLEVLDVPDIEPDKIYNAVPFHPTAYHVRHLERLRLGMSYVEQASYVYEIMHTAPLTKATLVVDQTGVGRPVVDLFRQAGLKPIAVTITAGDSTTREKLQPDDWHVAKLTLVSRLQATLHSGDLKIAADLPETAALVSELQDFKATFTQTGYARFGAREGKHDDLVLATAIALWWSKESTKRKTVVREFPFD
jgi:hypothetical protein